MFGIDDAILGGALSFGGQLLSGLGSMSAAKSQQKRMNAINAYNANTGNFMVGEYSFDRLMSDAKKFGFNPSTYLQTMGPVYGALQQQGWGMLNFSTDSQINKGSALSAVGGAITAGVKTWSDMTQTAQKANAQKFMAQAISSVRSARKTGNALAGLGTPAYERAGPDLSGGGAAAALSIGATPRTKSSKDEDDTEKTPGGLEIKDGSTTKLNDQPMLGWWKVDKNMPDSTTIEDIYGDGLPSSAYSYFKTYADWYYSKYGRSITSDWPADWAYKDRWGIGKTPGGLGFDRRNAHTLEAQRNDGFGTPPKFDYGAFFKGIAGPFKNPGPMEQYGYPSP